MNTAEKYHVMSVTPRQQASLRMLLFNLYCNYVNKSLQTLLDEKDGPSFPKAINSKIDSVIDNFGKYDEFTEAFCTRGQVHSAKIRFVTFSGEAMRNISLAIKTFNQNYDYLSSSDVQYIQSEIKKIEDLVAESLLYSYTEEEIKREMGT
jgi:hypothetical protein